MIVVGYEPTAVGGLAFNDVEATCDICVHGSAEGGGADGVVPMAGGLPYHKEAQKQAE